MISERIDEDYETEKEVWDKYEPTVVNKDDSRKYFFVVTEAKVIEGSAVPMGSNQFTPVLPKQFMTSKTEQPKTQQEIKDQAIKSWLEIEPLN